MLTLLVLRVRVKRMFNLQEVRRPGHMVIKFMASSRLLTSYLIQILSQQMDLLQMAVRNLNIFYCKGTIRVGTECHQQHSGLLKIRGRYSRMEKVR